jgi:glyoxylase I family protein
MVSGIPPLTGLSHLDLSVSDRHASASWYADVLGFDIRGDRFNEAAQLHWIHLVHPACGLSMGLVEHPNNPGARFDERRSGLDHVSFAVSTRAELEKLAQRIGEHAHETPPIIEASDALLLVLRDPDNIQVEVCFFNRPSE